MQGIQGIKLDHAEAYSQESFRCGSCNREYSANVITWVDVSRTPQVKQLIQRWEFNIVRCTHCGCRQPADTPFFYEDFEEGMLLAVFPRIPEGRGRVEASIKQKYGYYPVQEFFYDMTQLWTLLYLQEHYRANKNLRVLSTIGDGEQKLRRILGFLKEDPLMIDIRERLTESFFGDASEDQLMELLARAIYKLEDMLPWPMDRRCVCGADLSRELKCCGKPVNLDDHDRFLSRQYVIYCPDCKEALAGVSCDKCGRVFTWKVGNVRSYRKDRPQDQRVRDRPAASRNYPQFD